MSTPPAPHSSDRADRADRRPRTSPGVSLSADALEAVSGAGEREVFRRAKASAFVKLTLSFIVIATIVISVAGRCDASANAAHEAAARVAHYDTLARDARQAPPLQTIMLAGHLDFLEGSGIPAHVRGQAAHDSAITAVARRLRTHLEGAELLDTRDAVALLRAADRFAREFPDARVALPLPFRDSLRVRIGDRAEREIVALAGVAATPGNLWDAEVLADAAAEAVPTAADRYRRARERLESRRLVLLTALTRDSTDTSSTDLPQRRAYATYLATVLAGADGRPWVVRLTGAGGRTLAVAGPRDGSTAAPLYASSTARLALAQAGFSALTIEAGGVVRRFDLGADLRALRAGESADGEHATITRAAGAPAPPSVGRSLFAP